MDEFRAIVKKLVLEKAYRHSELVKEIRTIIEEQSKNGPFVNVLYCASYGSYGYSSEFQKFIKGNGEINEDNGCDDDNDSDSFDDDYCCNPKCRVDHALLIPSFAKTILGSFPVIKSMIEKYFAYKLDKVVENVKKYNHNKQSAINIQKLVEHFSNTPGSCFGDIDTDYSKNFLTVSDFTFKKHVGEFNLNMARKATFIRAAQDAVQVHQKYMETHLKSFSELGLNQGMIECMIETVDWKFPEEEAELKKSKYARRIWTKKLENQDDYKKMSLLEAVHYYGENHWAVWECQSTFSRIAMRFLVRFPDLFKEIVLDDDVNEKMLLKAGLAFASSSSCTLQVHKVPELMDWKIHEYDGLESIQVI